MTDRAREQIAFAAAYCDGIPEYLQEVAELSVCNGLAQYAMEEGLDHQSFLLGLLAASNTIEWLATDKFPGDWRQAFRSAKAHFAVTAKQYRLLGALIHQHVDPLKFASMTERAELRWQQEEAARKATPPKKEQQ